MRSIANRGENLVVVSEAREHDFVRAWRNRDAAIKKFVEEQCIQRFIGCARTHVVSWRGGAEEQSNKRCKALDTNGYTRRPEGVRK